MEVALIFRHHLRRRSSCCCLCVGGATVRLRRSSSSSTTATSNSNNSRVSSSSSPPWLMLSSPKNPQTRYFYDIISNSNSNSNSGSSIKLKREIHLPEIAGHHCIGSSQGFLITIDISRTTQIHLTNPNLLLKPPHLQHFTLPPIASLPLGTRYHYWRSIERGGYALPSATDRPNRLTGAHTPWTVPPQPILIDSNFELLYTSKAILSPSLDSLLLFYPRDQILVFSRLHIDDIGQGGGQCESSSSSSSSSREIWLEYVRDCIFHKGRFHAIIADPFTLAIYDDIHDLSLPPTFVKCRGPRISLTNPCYLVESPTGDDLFLVSRLIDYDDDYDYDESDADDDDVYPPHTSKFFTVRKLVYDHTEEEEEEEEKKCCKWEVVESLGDLAMFVGYNCSMSVSVRDYPNLTPNCIYFTDHLANNLDSHKEDNLLFNVSALGDTGVFNMEDETIHLYPLTDEDGIHHFNWPMPVWYMPTTAIC